MSTSDSARYDEAIEVKPKNARKAGTGSVHDPRSKYPSTITIVEGHGETNSRLDHCITARRPGGDYRAGHGFKTIACSCGGHPCTCGTEEAKKHVIHSNVNTTPYKDPNTGDRG